MKKLILATLIATLLIVTAVFSNAQTTQVSSSGIKLAVPNQISGWLLTKKGHDKYAKQYGEKYFLPFSTIDPYDPQLDELEDSYNYLQAKITGTPTDEKYTFAITQKVPGGKAGAVYLYPDSVIQDSRSVSSLEENILSTTKEWCSEHFTTITNTAYNPDDDRFMVITIAVPPSASTRSAAPAAAVATKNFNVLLYDPIKDADKLKLESQTRDSVTHIFNFPYNYTSKEKMLRRNLNKSLSEINDNEVIDAGSKNILRLHKKDGSEIEWSYYTHSATDSTAGTIDGMFLDYFVEPKLLNDERALSAFKAWFEYVVTDWGKLNGITWVIDRDKPGEHWFKFHTDVTPEAGPAPSDESGTSQSGTVPARRRK